MQDEQPQRGLLARLPPLPRFLWIVALTFGLLAILIWLDPSSFRSGWERDRLALIERVLNILVAAGTIWLVVAEGDAIIAAFARALANGLGVSMAAFAEALRRAGLSASDVQKILADVLALTPRWSPPKWGGRKADVDPERESAPPAGSDQSATPVHSTTVAGEAAAPKATAKPRKPIPWLRIAGGAAAIVALVVLIWRMSHQPPLPTPPPSPPSAEVWINAAGSISETLTSCTGAPSYEALEQAVADANGIACSRRSGALTCTIHDAQPLRLTPHVQSCVSGVRTFDSQDGAAMR